MATIEEESTADCLRRALAGDSSAYREFLMCVTPVMRGIVRAKLAGRDAQTVEDVLQETLLAIHAKRTTWRRDQPVLPWLYAIARHKAVDELRRGRRARDEVGMEHAAGLPAVDQQSPLTEAMDVERAVSLLEGRSQQVVRALGIEGASVAEVGTRFGISENAVRVAFHRGLTQLVRLRDVLTGEVTPADGEHQHEDR